MRAAGKGCAVCRRGRTVPEVETDCFIAADTRSALRDAGGGVLGPVSQGHQALALIAGGAPTCAVMDIHLGNGPCSAIAEALQGAGIPFVFVTGCADTRIPARSGRVELLRRPVPYGVVARAIARLGPGRT